MQSAFGELIKAPFKKARHSEKGVLNFGESGPSHETAVNANFGKIASGFNFKPADNSMGHLFGHGFCRTNPSRGMVRRKIKTKRRRRRRSSAGRYSVFSWFSRICRLRPLNTLALFSNEAAAEINISQTRLQSAFGKLTKGPYQKPPRSKREFRILKARFDPRWPEKRL